MEHPPPPKKKLQKIRCTLLFHAIINIFSYWTTSVSLCHAHSGVVVFHSPSRGQRDTRLCPYCYGYILGPSYSRHLTISPHDPTPPPRPPPSSHISGPSPLLTPLHPKRPKHPPARSRALVLSPSLSTPLAPFISGAAFPVGNSEHSLNTRLRRDPANA